MVPFLQFKKREKYQWRSVTFSKVELRVELRGSVGTASTCNLTKSNIPPGVFFTFFKLYKWYQSAQCITYEYSLWSIFCHELTPYSPACCVPTDPCNSTLWNIFPLNPCIVNCFKKTKNFFFLIGIGYKWLLLLFIH